MIEETHNAIGIIRGKSGDATLVRHRSWRWIRSKSPFPRVLAEAREKSWAIRGRDDRREGTFRHLGLATRPRRPLGALVGEDVHGMHAGRRVRTCRRELVFNA